MASIKKNISFNVIKTVCTILFPIVSYSYASRIIGITNIGKVNYSLSIVNYFVLLAALGITTYGIREGSKLRNDKEKITEFVSELFSINLISTVASYLLFAVLVFTIEKLQLYIKLILIQSLLIAATTLGVEWVYNIFEDFKYMAIRSILVQIVSLLGLVIFVKTESDIIIYALILTMSKTGSYLFGLFYVRRYVKIHFVLSGCLVRHLRPIFVLLGINIAQTIYTNSDTTMIGIFNSDTNVGLYTSAVNVYLGVKSIIYAIINVYAPRISFEKQAAEDSAILARRNQLYQILLLFAIPACVGLFMVSKDVIVAYGSEASYLSYIPLRILSIALVFSTFAGYKSSSYLIIENRENDVLRAMCISAALNVVLNFWFIPHFKQDGAAMTTLISEFTMWFLNTLSIRDLPKKDIKTNKRVYIEVVIGAVAVLLCCLVCGLVFNNLWIRLIGSILSSVFIYGIILLVTKNEFLYKMICGLLHRN